MRKAPIMPRAPVTPYKSFADKKKSKDRQGIAMLIGSGLVVVGFATVFALTREPERDPETGCLSGKTAPVQHAALVDRTEKLDASATHLLTTALSHWQGKAKVNERVTLYAFDGKAGAPLKILYDKCRPPGVTEINPLWTSAHVVEATFNETFVAPFTAAVTEATSMKSATETSLVAALGRLGGQLSYETKANRIALTIFSDMGEAGTAGSLIGKKPVDQKSFSDAVVRQLGDRFAKIDVVVTTIPTASTPAPIAKRIKEAWLKAFEAAGVRVTWGTL